MSRWHTDVHSHAVTVFIGFAAPAKLVRFVSVVASALYIYTLPFGLNPGDATETQEIGGRGIPITPPFTGPFCMSVGAQSIAQSWHASPLTS